MEAWSDDIKERTHLSTEEASCKQPTNNLFSAADQGLKDRAVGEALFTNHHAPMFTPANEAPTTTNVSTVNFPDLAFRSQTKKLDRGNCRPIRLLSQNVYVLTSNGEAASEIGRFKT